MTVNGESRTSQRMPAEERRARILEVAYEAFATLGYDGVSMEEIARRVGVTKPILYRHFASKDDLCAECLYLLGAQMLEGVRNATDPSLPADGQLWAGIQAYLRFIQEHKNEWRVFMREAPLRGGAAAEAVASGRSAATSMLSDLLDQVIVTGGAPTLSRLELDAQAHLFQGAVEHVALWWEAHPEQPMELVALRTMNFVWQGAGRLFKGQYWLPGVRKPGIRKEKGSQGS